MIADIRFNTSGLKKLLCARLPQPQSQVTFRQGLQKSVLGIIRLQYNFTQQQQQQNSQEEHKVVLSATQKLNVSVCEACLNTSIVTFIYPPPPKSYNKSTAVAVLTAHFNSIFKINKVWNYLKCVFFCSYNGIHAC